jgi:hypothetical protein
MLTPVNLDQLPDARPARPRREAPGIAAVLSYVEYLPETVADRIRSVTQHYRLDLHSETGGTFWMNHGEPGSPFGPMPDEGLEAIRLHEVREPFAARAGGESHDVKPLDS